MAKLLERDYLLNNPSIDKIKTRFDGEQFKLVIGYNHGERWTCDNETFFNNVDMVVYLNELVQHDYSRNISRAGSMLLV